MAFDAVVFKMVLNASPFERKQIIERPSLSVRIQLVKVAHGRLQPGGCPASLIIMELILPSRMSLSIRDLRFAMEFTNQQSKSSGHKSPTTLDNPEVIALAPNGIFSIKGLPAVEGGETSKEAEAEAQDDAGDSDHKYASSTWEFVQRRDGKERLDQARFEGTMRIDERPFGPRNIASWSLSGSKRRQKPAAGGFRIRIAVLLRRRNSVPFTAQLELDMTAATTSRPWLGMYEKFRKIRSSQDPEAYKVYFDPQKPLIPQSQSYRDIDLNNLEAFDIKACAGIVEELDLVENSDDTSQFR